MLRRRLANGEISAEEYEKRKVILDQDSWQAMP
ncbi:SHOCT domain-containing protein [Polaromonas sp. P1(28)-8]|nr:SHOCT domain-containing protein [Polaromonas sp. P1(28)-8]